ncbi:MAG: hypothetical protein ACAH59_00605 [Pseudobdellovibrionaceae bacterium]
MSSKSSLFKGLALILTLGFLNACSSSGDEAREAAEKEEQEKTQAMQIELSEVSDSRCLNIEKYFQLLRDLPAETRARKMTKDLNVRTIGASLPRNFFLRLAAGNFQIRDGNLTEFPELLKVTQAECTSVTFNEEGHQEIYKIKEANADSLLLENNWDGQIFIRWTSPVSMEFRTTSVVGDYLCSGSSKAKVTVSETINWGRDDIFTTTIGDSEIDPSYLSLVSEATGFAFVSLYSNQVPPAFSPKPIPTPQPEQPEEEGEDDSITPDPEDVGPGMFVNDDIQPTAPGDRQLVVSKLKELQASPIRPDLMMCY